MTQRDYSTIISELSREELLELSKFLAASWWHLQNNWMQNIDLRYGTEATVELDGLIFGRAAAVQARRLQKIFKLGNDIPSLMKALDISTVLANVEWEWTKVSDKQCIYKVTRCNQQLARMAGGLPELPCKTASISINSNFASAFNPKIKTTCLLCPPDNHAKDKWCEFQFDLED
jgi:hypothetical protein